MDKTSKIPITYLNDVVGEIYAYQNGVTNIFVNSGPTPLGVDLYELIKLSDQGLVYAYITISLDPRDRPEDNKTKIKQACDDTLAKMKEYTDQIEKEHDPVNHPNHYTSHPSGVECIDISRHMNFNLGNVMKYIWRSGLKDNAPEVQDLEKALWYLQDEINKQKEANGI